MRREELISKLCEPRGGKMILLVMDGVGGLPGPEGLTELERASKPHMDELAARSDLGMMHVVGVGITPGSGPGHLALFGYDPLEHQIGRGILEALGIGASVLPGEVAARANFATFDGEVVVDRRAGRISTEESRGLVELLSREIEEVEGVKVRFYPGKEHRFVVVFSGGELGERVSDADPGREGERMTWARAEDESDGASARTARAANALIRRVREVLGSHPRANGCLVRGFALPPDIRSLEELYGIRACALAVYPMYKGLARLVGMDVVEGLRDLSHAVEELSRLYDSYDYFFLHVKYTDSRGEDGDFEAKVRVIEEVDLHIPRILSLNPQVLAITGDHSTPSLMRSHSWHPVPLLLFSPYARPTARSFGERSCMGGSLGFFYAKDLMGLMLSCAGRLSKFGA